ncbi:DDB1- and CUL4-associated factor 10 [Bacillus rossius redtenbacheri]|uniref:DDB1- and CUL4-associated factor 10 n=1 Tax=Bacillus rossius redtenbacheri TaxID=93214 RepID=UPI002FDE0EA2
MPKVKTKIMNYNWLRNRELGQRPNLGFSDKFSKGLYSSLKPCTSWEYGEDPNTAMHGGVFNLEFSPDGSLLVAACEKKSILMFDPLCRKLIHAVEDAHRDCVNCVRFLDSRVFATCSDDSTVALWDARNLKTQIRTLHGHSNWVKNVEFSPRDGLLVSSGFDGSIYTWDINSYTENGFVYNKVFQTNGLMRTRLTPDASKMVICTTSGYLIVIHNLDLNTMAQDLDGFKPNMYRLMQISQTTIPLAAESTHLFSQERKTNRVEFLTDFPAGDEAEVVSSLQIHPQGWCALSRNITNDESSEWTCVHDIQDRETPDPFEVESSEGKACKPPPEQVLSESGTNASSGLVSVPIQTFHPVHSGSDQALRGFSPVSSGPHARRTRPPRGEEGDRTARRHGAVGDTFQRFSPSNVELHVSSSDVWEALVAIRDARVRREREREQERERERERERRFNVRIRSSPDAEEAEHRSGRLRIFVRRNYAILDGSPGEEAGDRGVPAPRPPAGGGERPGATDAPRTFLLVSSHSTADPNSHFSIYRASATQPRLPPAPGNPAIHQNAKRLTHYVEEPNVGKGFIKELCFSADGRLVCSPFGYGVRLLAFSPECEELSACVPAAPPVKLHELAASVCHKDIVVSTKFSPRHCLLVSGCLSGRVVWHQPVL